MMQLPPENHIAWKILILAVLGAVLCVMLSVNYQNGWDSTTDLRTVFATLAAYIVAELGVKRISKGGQ